jgi:hypothetical protein
MAEIKVYRTYDHFRDPVLDQVAALIEKEGLTKKLGVVAEISNVGRQTIGRWLDGTTRYPRYATVMAVTSSLNYQPGDFRRTEKLDVEAARKAAAKWKEQQKKKKESAKARSIAKRKAARTNGIHVAGATQYRS